MCHIILLYKLPKFFHNRFIMNTKNHKYKYSYSPRETIHERKQKAYKQIFLISFCVIIITILIFTNINQIIDFLTQAWNRMETNEEVENGNDTNLKKNTLSAPQIDSLPALTNQKKITVSGFASEGMQVELFFNGSSISVDDLDENKNFEFTDLNLMSGENTITVQAIAENGEKSDMSEITKVTLDLQPPTLEITAPSDNTEFGKEAQRIEIKGQTEIDAKLYVNEHIAILKQDGTFIYNLTLNEGENIIKIKAIDKANNEMEKTLTLNFNPEKTE